MELVENNDVTRSFHGHHFRKSSIFGERFHRIRVDDRKKNTERNTRVFKRTRTIGMSKYHSKTVHVCGEIFKEEKSFCGFNRKRIRVDWAFIGYADGDLYISEKNKK